MAEDLVFNKIIKKLEEIHKEFPDLRFGLCLQSAVDKNDNNKNKDFHNISSKAILIALDDFQRETRVRRGKK